MSFTFWESVLLKPLDYRWKVTCSISCGFLGVLFSSGLLMILAFSTATACSKQLKVESCCFQLLPLLPTFQDHSSFSLSANPGKTLLTCACCGSQTFAVGSGLFVHFFFFFFFVHFLSLPHHRSSSLTMISHRVSLSHPAVIPLCPVHLFRVLYAVSVDQL